jgi:hypothetical protein
LPVSARRYPRKERNKSETTHGFSQKRQEKRGKKPLRASGGLRTGENSLAGKRSLSASMRQKRANCGCFDRDYPESCFIIRDQEKSFEFFLRLGRKRIQQSRAREQAAACKLSIDSN